MIPEALFRYNVCLAVQEVVQVLPEAAEIEEAAVRREINKEINVAGLIGLTAGDGAEYAHVRGAVAGAIRRISSRFSRNSVERCIL